MATPSADLETQVSMLVGEGKYDEALQLLQVNTETFSKYEKTSSPGTYPVGDMSTNILQPELWRDKALQLASKQKICHMCNNLDARGHPQGQIQRSNGRLISSVQLQGMGPGLIRTFWQTIDCGYCEIIYRAGNKIIDRDPEIQWCLFQSLESITLVEDHPILLTVRCLTKSRKWTHIGIELFKRPDTNVRGLPTIGSAVPIELDAGSEECLSFIKSNLEICKESHHTCQQELAPLPKRVLRLRDAGFGMPHASTVPFVNLHISKPSEKHSYIALSHCWGRDTKKELKLTRKTQGDLERSVQWDDMPETFRDGIMVAWRLGIHYIWIDSLCIVQGDKKDWEIEAAKMGDIYHHAYLTVAATSSPSGDVQFLRKRPNVHPTEEIKIYKPGKVSFLTWIARKMTRRKGTIFARRTCKVAYREEAIAGWSKTDVPSNEIPGQLSTRAWCLQERMLSNRIVHFTDEGIMWECKGFTRSEDQRSWLPGPLTKWEHFRAISSVNDVNGRPTSFLSGKPVTETTFLEACMMRDDLQTFWRHMVTEYTKRDMTYRSDVFAAISSIAARMHSYIESPYIAGLWRDRFIEDLCWRPVIKSRSQAPLMKPDDIIAGVPSWSWMSIDRSIGYAVTDIPGVFVSHCKLVGGQCLEQSDGLNPYNTLAGPSAVLEGRMVELDMTFHGHWHGADSQSASVSSKTPPTASNTTMHFFATVMYDAPLMEDEAIDASGKRIKTVRRAREGENLEWFKSSVFCLDIGNWTPDKTSRSLEGLDHNFVLVLAPSVTVPGAFERLGMTNSSHGTANRKAWDEVLITRVTIV